MKSLPRTLVLSSLLIFLTSCGTGNGPESGLDIIDGTRQIPSQLRPFFTVIRKIRTPKGGICTGTFVSSEMVVTAAHCVIDSRFRVRNISIDGISSVSVAVAPGYDKRDSTARRRQLDIAYVRMPRGSAGALGVQRFFGFASQGVRVGTRVWVAGYGRTKNSGAGTFRWGSNLVSNVRNRTITISEDNGAVGFKGDSGGPLFVDGMGIVGVTSGGRFVQGQRIETYTRTDSPESVAAFRRVAN